METIPKSDCTNIGFLKKTHGVHGELSLEFELQFEESVEEASRFFIKIDGLLVPFFLSENGLRFKTAKTAIIKFDDVDSENYARRLTGTQVFLYNDEIVAHPEADIESFLLNFKLTGKNSGHVGTIIQIDDYSGNIVLTVETATGEVLIPFNEDFLVEIDQAQQTIELDLPEGLLEDLD